MATKQLRTGRVYKLTNPVDDEIFIGGSFQKFRVILENHKAHRKRYPQRPLYKHLNTIGIAGIKLELVGEHECATVKELNVFIREYIEKLKPSLNSYRKAKPPKPKKPKVKKPKLAAWHTRETRCGCGAKLKLCSQKQHLESSSHLLWLASHKIVLMAAALKAATK